MSKKNLLTLAAAIALTVGTANAYTQNYFGTGFGFNPVVNSNNTGAVTSSALNQPVESFTETKDETEGSYKFQEGPIKYSDRKVSTIFGDHDEAANAGYKKTNNYVVNDGEDFNPYTGDGTGVNSSKSIYTDSLGRNHFFGRANRFRTKD